MSEPTYVIHKGTSTLNGCLGVIVKRVSSQGKEVCVCKKIKGGKVFKCPDVRCVDGCVICQFVLPESELFILKGKDLEFYKKNRMTP